MDPERVNQPYIPPAQDLLDYNAAAPAARRDTWLKRFYEIKNELVEEARAKVLRDEQLADALIRLVTDVKQVSTYFKSTY